MTMLSTARRKPRHFTRQAADKYVEIGDVANEGRAQEQSRRHPAQAPPPRRSAAGNPPGDRMQSAVRPRVLEPWTTWAILADIETDAGNPAAAAEAKRKAIACYLAYRRDGGENHDHDGRIGLAVTQSLLAGDPAPPRPRLQQVAADPALPRDAPPLHPSPPSHRRRQPRPHPRRRPGFGLHDGRRNPLPDRGAGKRPLTGAVRRSPRPTT